MRLLAVLCSLLAATVLARATEVAPGITLVPGSFVPGSQPDGNTVILDAPGGLIVVDTGRHPEHVAAILAAVKAAGKPVAAIVNSHWHLDHIGGNAALREAFPRARVLASGALAGARAGFLADYRKQLEQMVAGEPDAEKQKPWRAEIALIDAGKKLEPDEVVKASGPRKLAGRPVAVHLEKNAVTAGDVWLVDPATKTVIAGDLVTLPVPFLDTACPGRWAEALDRLAAVDFAVLVPGHGAPMKKADLVTYKTAFDNLVACAASKKDKAECIAGWQKDAASLLGDADPKFVGMLLDYYVEGVLRGYDAKKVAGLCGRKTS